MSETTIPYTQTQMDMIQGHFRDRRPRIIYYSDEGRQEYAEKLIALAEKNGLPAPENPFPTNKDLFAEHRRTEGAMAANLQELITYFDDPTLSKMFSEMIDSKIQTTDGLLFIPFLPADEELLEPDHSIFEDPEVIAYNEMCFEVMKAIKREGDSPLTKEQYADANTLATEHFSDMINDNDDAWED